jgi:hypothetical protein
MILMLATFSLLCIHTFLTLSIAPGFDAPWRQCVCIQIHQPHRKAPELQYPVWRPKIAIAIAVNPVRELPFIEVPWINSTERRCMINSTEGTDIMTDKNDIQHQR